MTLTRILLITFMIALCVSCVRNEQTTQAAQDTKTPRATYSGGVSFRKATIPVTVFVVTATFTPTTKPHEATPRRTQNFSDTNFPTYSLGDSK